MFPKVLIKSCCIRAQITRILLQIFDLNFVIMDFLTRNGMIRSFMFLKVLMRGCFKCAQTTRILFNQYFINRVFLTRKFMLCKLMLLKSFI